jgi:L,D-transpeptidase ErfK/SrfK
MKTAVTDTSKKDFFIYLFFTSIIPLFLIKIANSIKSFFLSKYLKRFFIIIFVFGGTIGISISSVFVLPAIENFALFFKTWDINSNISADQLDLSINSNVAKTEKNIKKLKNLLTVKLPKTSYLVVNTSDNHFYLYKKNKLIRDGLCSTGSYIKLEGEGEQKWIFKTPRGEFKIRDKKVDPVWKKPDWAFIEEGLPVPSKNHSSRFEYGSLGDYALILGDGYMIHGTLYQRFLGKPVTHGCVRLGDDDLKQVFSTLNIGSKVYMF